jgi:DNA-directed RNA polymerase subunit RPC12/RpoP
MNPIAKFNCPNCGAVLELSADMLQFACAYCGAGLLLEKRGGALLLRTVTEAIQRVQVGTDKTAAELAIKRYQEELRSLLAQHKTLRDSKDTASWQLVGCAPIFGLVGIWIVCSWSVLGWVLVLVGGLIAAHAYQAEETDGTQIAALEPRINELRALLAEKKQIADG